MWKESAGRKRFYPADSLESPRFTGPFTFARLPYSRDLEDLDAVFLGIPFDGGVVFRPGARFGPAAVRQASLLLRLYNPYLKVRPFDILNVADYGDISVVPNSIEMTYQRISEEVGRILDADVTPIICGGDHSITLPILRAFSKKYGEVNLIHVDAHLDMVDSHFSHKFTHGTVFKRAIEEKLIAPENSVHIAIRGSLFSEHELMEARDLGFKVITMTEIEEKGLDPICREIKYGLMRKKVYLSFDIDACDPSCAPGTGTPEIGGLTPREALRLIHSFEGIDLIGFDMVEVSPLYDHGEITAFLASNLIFEMLSLLALKNLRREKREGVDGRLVA